MTNKNTNVLYVSPNGFVGGAEAFVLEVSKSHLNTHNFNIINLFFNDGDAINISINNNIPTFLIKNKFRLSRPLKLLKAILEIRSFLKEHNIHIIHSTMPYAHIVMFLSSIFLGIKRVWFQHGPIGGILDKIANWLPVDSIMFNSKFLVEEHAKLMGLKPKWGQKIIPLGIAKKEVTNPQIEDLLSFCQSTEPIIAGVAGRINRFKGYHIFIDAIKILENTIPSPIWERSFFPIIGGANSDADKEYLKELEQQVKDLNLEKKVCFLGHKSNINDYLQQMDVFLHCSPEEEAISIVAAEAMLQNTLVIGSGIGDVVIHEKTGFECNTDGPEPEVLLGEILGNVLIKLDQNKDFYQDMKDQALELVTNEYSKEKMISDIESVYFELS